MNIDDFLNRVRAISFEKRGFDLRLRTKCGGDCPIVAVADLETERVFFSGDPMSAARAIGLSTADAHDLIAASDTNFTSTYGSETNGTFERRKTLRARMVEAMGLHGDPS